MRRRLRLPRERRPATALVVGGAFALAVALWAGAFAWRFSRDGQHFDFVRWEIATAPGKWLFALGRPLRSDLPGDEAIARYFALDDRDGTEARRLENIVERAIEGHIDAVLRDEGVRGRLGLAGPLALWPPVDLELARSPMMLVTSPRSRIAIASREWLRPDLDLAAAEALERAAEASDPSRAALVVPTGGLSVYPAVVQETDSYAGAVAAAAHEWVHHYLAFYPLGVGLPDGTRLAINETVADVAGQAIAGRVLARFGDPTARPAPPGTLASPGTPAPAPTPIVDRNRVLRELRLEVDALLAQGRVADAERRMEEVRQQLEHAGVRIRRINQAYFAWYGTYTARPDSVDPLGGQVRDVLARSPSLGAFLASMRGATTRADVQALLGAR